MDYYDVLKNEKTPVLHVIKNIPFLAFLILFLSFLPSVICSDSEMNNTKLHFDYALIAIYGICIIVIWMIYYAFECACCKKNPELCHDIERAVVNSIPLEDMMETQPLLCLPATFDVHNEESTMTDTEVISESESEAICSDMFIDNDTDTDTFPITSLHPNTTEQFNYHENSILIGKDKIANCDHQAVFVKFDKFTNVDTAFILNKSLQMSRQIENKDIEKYIYHTENCPSQPMQRNIGKGRKTENKTKVTSMKLNEESNTKC